ncbi:MAG: hypothetical protein GQE15_17175 [Archangiaceae bacterium]|nr:hypothetical protein [Archangiaceae bacterium]
MRQVLVLVVLCSVVGLAAPKKKVVKAEPPVAGAPVTPFVAVAPVRLSDEYTELEPRAIELLHAELSKFELELADEGADGGVKGQGVTVQLSVDAAREQMRGTLRVTKLPGGGLRGSWFVHASGPAPADLLEAVIPALIDESSTDLGWKARDAGAADAGP